MKDAALHFFVSEAGEILPRWRQAFPKAIGIPSAQLAAVSFMPDILWLRLQKSSSVREQVENMHRNFGRKTPIVVLSDMPRDQEALAAFAASVKGYANTHASPNILVNIAEVVSRNGIWVGESLMKRLKEWIK